MLVALFSAHSPLACVLSLALAAAPARVVSDAEAKRLVDEAKQAFSVGDYAEAADKIEAAYLIEPAPTLLYPWAQAERSRGNCRTAVELYQKFIDSEPGEAISAQARENIDRCEEQLAREADEEEEEEEDEDEDIVDAVLADPNPLAAVEPEPDTRTPTDDVRPWHKDPAGGVLLGVGLAGVGVGLGLYGGASSIAKSVADEESHQAYAERRQRATGLRTGGVVAVSIGGALIVGAVIRYATQSRKAKKGELTGWVDPWGGGLGWTGRF
jgi:tetratricopeptide (TPR) repeat protein